MKCPYCSSTDTIFKAKAGKWECNSCEERFEGASSDSSAPTPAPATKAAKPKRIFFSYGHDANRELIDRFKTYRGVFVVANRWFLLYEYFFSSASLKPRAVP
jgi:hypothetical protein